MDNCGKKLSSIRRLVTLLFPYNFLILMTDALPLNMQQSPSF